ncbi:MAG: type I restriction-modification system subunit M [Mycoplasmataceae bacterium]|nr:type I restriction-modification system subunit M [Mycoplasmataceae bacterium]
MSQTAINSLIGDEQKKQLKKKLWEAADVLRDKINVVFQMSYITGFMFYRYLSEQLEEHVNEDLKNDGLKYIYIYSSQVSDKYKDYSIKNLGYFLEPKYSWKEIISKIKKGDATWTIDFKKGMKQIEESDESFKGLFAGVDLDNPKIAKDSAERRRNFEQILESIDSINISFNDKHIDLLGETYEYLLGKFFESSISEAGKYFTPQSVSEIMAKIVTYGKTQAKSVYDPTCGTGSLLFRVYKELNGKVAKIYGQDTDGELIGLAKKNMLLHGIKHDGFSLEQDNTLTSPQHLNTKMEIIVANPPFNASKWMNKKSADEWLGDERFKEWGTVSNDSNADWMFMAHIIYHLVPNGIGATLFDTGILTRGGVEKELRTYAVKNKNVIDTVILLPAKIFNKTGTQACLVVFKKNRTNKDILFINAEDEFVKGKAKNLLGKENINNIVNSYINRKDVEHFSRVVSLDEVIKNDCDLNISNYVQKKVEEVEIDIVSARKQFEENAQKINQLWAKIKEFEDELVEVEDE